MSLGHESTFLFFHFIFCIRKHADKETNVKIIQYFVGIFGCEICQQMIFLICFFVLDLVFFIMKIGC